MKISLPLLLKLIEFLSRMDCYSDGDDTHTDSYKAHRLKEDLMKEMGASE